MKKKARDAFCLFRPLLYICKRDTTRKCCFRTSQVSVLIGATVNTEGLHSQTCELQFSSERESKKKNQTCGSVRGCQGVEHALAQKSRCRSLPKNSKILMFWPTGRLQNLLHVNNVSKSLPTIPSIKNLETFKLRQPWEYKPHVFFC